MNYFLENETQTKIVFIPNPNNDYTDKLLVEYAKANNIGIITCDRAMALWAKRFNNVDCVVLDSINYLHRIANTQEEDVDSNFTKSSSIDINESNNLIISSTTFNEEDIEEDDDDTTTDEIPSYFPQVKNSVAEFDMNNWKIPNSASIFITNSEGKRKFTRNFLDSIDIQKGDIIIVADNSENTEVIGCQLCSYEVKSSNYKLLEKKLFTLEELDNLDNIKLDDYNKLSILKKWKRRHKKHRQNQ